MEDKYYSIDASAIPEKFHIENGHIFLNNSKSLPIHFDFPLILDEDFAKVVAMILDGSVSKKLSGFMFSQKKDNSKIIEFFDIIQNKFCLIGYIYLDKNTGSRRVSYNLKTLTHFFYLCLDIHKSDETARIPWWIWKSPISVIKEYVRYAFAMEGSVNHHLKGSEIRFHSVDMSYLKELQKLIKDRFDVNFRLFRYHIKRYGWKYYLFITSKKEIIKFAKIGFALKTHQKRLDELISSFKPKAWQTTLMSIHNLKKNEFTLSVICIIFPYLKRASVYCRIFELLKKNYVQRNNNGYSLTKHGEKVVLSMKKEVDIVPLRTKPKVNEKNILNLIETKGKSYRNEIARELKIDPCTVRDVLKRLVNSNKIEFVEKDKFQRKFYRIQLS